MVNLTTHSWWIRVLKIFLKIFLDIFKHLSQNGLQRIAKIQKLSQNELEQITKMRNVLQNYLEQIPKMRRIKHYKNMAKEELLIAPLKSNQSLAELYKSKSNSTEIEKTKKIF